MPHHRPISPCRRDIRRRRRTQKRSLWQMIKDVLGRLRDVKVPASDETLGEQAKKTPGKALRMGDAYLDERPIQNELRVAQTEKEYAKVKLLRAQKKLVDQQTSRERADTVLKELEILQRIERLREVNRLPRVVGQDGREVIVLSDLTRLLEVHVATTDDKAETAGHEPND